jgi:hypothetical protein
MTLQNFKCTAILGRSDVEVLAKNIEADYIHFSLFLLRKVSKTITAHEKEIDRIKLLRLTL